MAGLEIVSICVRVVSKILIRREKNTSLTFSSLFRIFLTLEKVPVLEGLEDAHFTGPTPYVFSLPLFYCMQIVLLGAFLLKLLLRMSKLSGLLHRDDNAGDFPIYMGP